MWRRNAFVAMVVGVLFVTGCSATEVDPVDEGDGGSGAASGACLVGVPNCQDTVVDGEVPTDFEEPGSLPLADPAPTSGGMIVDPLSVAEALAYEGSEIVAVEGFVVRVGDETRLCDALAESFPPQCGGDSVTITNPDAINGLVLEEEGSTQWSPDLVTVLGEMTASGLTIDPTSI